MEENTITIELTKTELNEIINGLCRSEKYLEKHFFELIDAYKQNKKEYESKNILDWGVAWYDNENLIKRFSKLYYEKFKSIDDYELKLDGINLD